MGIIAKTYILDVLGNARTGLSSGTLSSPTVSHMSDSSLRVQDQGPRGCGRMKLAMTWHPYDRGDSVQYTGPNLFQWNQAITSSSTTNIWKVRELHKFSLFFQHPGFLGHPSFLCFLSLLWHCFFLYALSLTPILFAKKWKARIQEDSQLKRLCSLPLNPYFKNYRIQNEDRYYEPENYHLGEIALVRGGGRWKLWENSCPFLLLPVSFWEDAQPTGSWSGSLNSAGGSAQCHVPCKGESHLVQMPHLYLLLLQTPGCEVNRLGDNCFPEYLFMNLYKPNPMLPPQKNICLYFSILFFLDSGPITEAPCHSSVAHDEEVYYMPILLLHA